MKIDLSLRQACAGCSNDSRTNRKFLSKPFKKVMSVIMSGILAATMTPIPLSHAYAASESLQTATPEIIVDSSDNVPVINEKSSVESNERLTSAGNEGLYSASTEADRLMLKKGNAYAIYEGTDLIFVRSEAEFESGTELSIENPLISISGQVYASGIVCSGFENTPYSNNDELPWEDYRFDIDTVRFADLISPISCNRWFNDCFNLKSVESVYNLDTSNVKNTSHMFNGCDMLQSLDLSSWNMSSVEESEAMFEDCTELTNLNLSGWNFRSKDMVDMFNGCDNLEFLDLSGFDTHNTFDMNSMFSNCDSLDTLRLGINFSFWGNYSEAQCGVGSFDDKWYKTDGAYSNLSGGTDGEFASSYGREGGMEGVWKKGTYKNGSAYAVFDSETGILSFTRMRANELPQGKSCFEVRETGTYSLNDLPAWTQLGSAVKKIVFDEAIYPQSTAFWFNGFQDVEYIDINALDTKNTTNMTSMFRNCSALEFIGGLECLRTNNVVSMSNMFEGCRSLGALNLSSFNTAKASSNMRNMFSGCQALEQVMFGNQFRFGTDCYLPTPIGEGLSGKWAPDHNYSSDQKTSAELANTSFGSRLKGLWVCGNQLSYVIKYYDGDTLKAIKTYPVDLDCNLPVAKSLGIEASDGFENFQGWTDAKEKVSDFQMVIARDTIAPGTVISRYAVWSRNITVYAGLTNRESDNIPQFRNGAYHSASLPSTLFKRISQTSTWTPLGWADSKNEISKFDEQVIPTKADGSCQYNGNANELYAVYGRNVELVYNANTQDPVTMPANTVAVQYYLASEIEPFDAVFEIPKNSSARRKGYRIQGFTNSPSGTKGDDFIRFNPRLDAVGTELVCTAYAVWEAISYTIEFDNNGGEGTMTPQERSYDDGIALRTSTFTKTGYRLIGWTKSLTSESPVVYPVDYTGNITNEKTKLTLYAVWELVNYDINLSFEGATLGQNEGWTINNETKKATRQFTVEDSIELPTNVTKEGSLFNGWRNDQNQVVSTIEKGSTENRNLVASWLTIADEPKCDNDLVYTGDSLTLIEAGNGYELQSPSTNGSIDNNGNLVGTVAGTYTAVAKLKEGFVWGDGTLEDKQCSVEVKQATIDKVVIPSIAFGASGNSAVGNMDVYTKNQKGDFLKLTKPEDDISTEVTINGSIDYVVVKGKSSNVSSSSSMNAPYEITPNPQGRRTETINKDGAFLSKTLEELNGSAPLVKKVTYRDETNGSNVNLASYVGNNIVLDSNDSVQNGVDAAIMTSLAYSGDSLVSDVSKSYVKADNRDLAFSGSLIDGAREYTVSNTQYKNDGSGKKLVTTYEAALNDALKINNDEVSGAVRSTSVTSSFDANKNETITNVTTYDEDRNTDGKVFETLEGYYSGNSLGFANGKVSSGATEATLVHTVYGEERVIETTTKYTAFSGSTLDTSGDEIKGAEIVKRTIVTKNADGKVVRYEIITSQFDRDGKETVSRVLYEGEDIIIDPSTGAVKSGGKTVSENNWTVDSESENEKTISSREVDQDSEGNKIYNDVSTNISKKDDGSIIITRTEQQKDANNNPIGEPKTYVFKVVDSIDASGLRTTRVINQYTQEETITIRDLSGTIIVVRNDQVNLTGGALTTLPKASDWIWLDVKKDSAQASSRSAEVKKDYVDKKYDNPTIYTSRLNIIDSDSGIFNACRFGLNGMGVQIHLSGNSAFANRIAHITQVDSSSIFDVKKLDDALIDENEILSFKADSLNDIVIAIDRLGRKVTFNANKGSAVKEAVVLDGDKVARPADPTRVGYVFDGWFSDAACTRAYDFNAEVKANITLYAKWKGDLSASNIALSATSSTYTGNTFTPSIKSAALSDGAAVDASNYKVTYVASDKKTIVEPKVAGTYYAKVEGVNGCVNAKYLVFKIAKANLSSSKAVLNKTSVNFNGKKQKPGVKSVTFGTRVLSRSSDYTVSYSANKNIGKAKIKIKGKGNYTGTKTMTFAIKAVSNPFKATPRAKLYTASSKKNTGFTAAQLYKITNDKSKGQRVYAITARSKSAKVFKNKFKLSSKNGNIVVAKGVKKGTYALKVRVATKAKGNYKTTLRYVIIKIRVK